MPTVTDLNWQSNEETLSPRSRMLVLVVAFAALVFDGVELGLMPVASLSVSQSLLGDAYTPTLGGDWFARFTAAMMLGAAIGGIAWAALAIASAALERWESAFSLTRSLPRWEHGHRLRSKCLCCVF